MFDVIAWIVTFVVTVAVLTLVASLLGGIGSFELVLFLLVGAAVATIVVLRRRGRTAPG